MTRPALSGPMPDDARSCPKMPDHARSAPIRPNEPNLLGNAAADVADALVAQATVADAVAALASALVEPVPDDARPCPKMPENARSALNLQNEPNSLSPQQQTAVRMLLAGAKLTGVARELRIDPKTLFRWRQAPAFVAELNRQHERLCRKLKPEAPSVRRRERRESVYRPLSQDRTLRDLERKLGLL